MNANERESGEFISVYSRAFAVESRSGGGFELLLVGSWKELLDSAESGTTIQQKKLSSGFCGERMILKMKM
jgi:hypothetical protein